MAQKFITKRLYKHKLLLDEHVHPRQALSRLNQIFDVKHIEHDLRLGGIDDPSLYALANEQGRIVVTSNAKDFRPLVKKGDPGVIIIPSTWEAEKIDTKLLAYLRQHRRNFFLGRAIALAGIRTEVSK